MQIGTTGTRELVTCVASDTVLQAAELMRNGHVGDVIVVQYRDGKPVPGADRQDRRHLGSGFGVGYGLRQAGADVAFALGVQGKVRGAGGDPVAQHGAQIVQPAQGQTRSTVTRSGWKARCPAMAVSPSPGVS